MPLPNDRNISTQHMATVLGPTCCARLSTLSCDVVRRVKCCKSNWCAWCIIIARAWPNEYNIMQHPTNFALKIWPFLNLSQQYPSCRNISQQGGHTCETCRDQQLTNKEASTVLCSVEKHAGSGRARQKYRGKQETKSSVFSYFLSALSPP